MRISIIVPVYNSEKYIGPCLDSLLNQSLLDLEVIAIDDGSSDHSWSILETYQAKDSRIRIFHQENQGISATRNFGIDVSKGDYIGFLDSDDYMDEDMLKIMYDKVIQDDLDLVVCDFYEVDEISGQRIEKNIPAFDPTTLQKEPRLLFDINSSPWNKLYRRSYLMQHAIRFPLQLKYEDTVFVIHAMIKAERIGQVQRPLLYYRVHGGSETTVQDQRVFDIFAILDQIRDLFPNLTKESEGYTYLEYFTINRITVYQLQQIYQKDKATAMRFLKESTMYLNTNFPSWRSNPHFIKQNSLAKRFIKQYAFLMKCYVQVRYRGGTTI